MYSIHPRGAFGLGFATATRARSASTLPASAFSASLSSLHASTAAMAALPRARFWLGSLLDEVSEELGPDDSSPDSGPIVRRSSAMSPRRFAFKRRIWLSILLIFRIKDLLPILALLAVGAS